MARGHLVRLKCFCLCYLFGDSVFVCFSYTLFGISTLELRLIRNFRIRKKIARNKATPLTSDCQVWVVHHVFWYCRFHVDKLSSAHVYLRLPKVKKKIKKNPRYSRYGTFSN